MSNTISPFLRSPFTEITGGMVSHQLGRCAKEEMSLMECMEAYGIGRGREKCKDCADDYFECQKTLKQFKRFVVMRAERNKQISEGKLTGDKKYVTPRIDAY